MNKEIKVGDKIVYGSIGVCEVTDITENKIAGRRRKYYVLMPEENANNSIFVPMDNQELVGRIRDLHSEDDLKLLIEIAKRTEQMWIEGTNDRSAAFKTIMANGKTEEIISMVRKIDSVKKELESENKKLSKSDERLFKDGIAILTNEFSRVLNATQEEMLEMIL